jgi:hypothetical protein
MKSDGDSVVAGFEDESLVPHTKMSAFAAVPLSRLTYFAGAI